MGVKMNDLPVAGSQLRLAIDPEAKIMRSELRPNKGVGPHGFHNINHQLRLEQAIFRRLSQTDMLGPDTQTGRSGLWCFEKIVAIQIDLDFLGNEFLTTVRNVPVKKIDAG